MKTKTLKTPLLMAAAPGPTSCSSGIAPVSKLPAQAKSPVRFGSQTQPSSWQKPSALQASKTKVRLCAALCFTTMVILCAQPFLSEAMFLPDERLKPRKWLGRVVWLWRKSWLLKTESYRLAQRLGKRINLSEGVV